MTTRPEYWCRTRPTRPPNNWRAIGASFALGALSGLLVVAGAALVGFGAGWLGGAVTAAGVATFVAASFLEV